MSYFSPSTTSQEYAIREHAQIDEEAILSPLQFPMVATQSQLSTPRDSRWDRPAVNIPIYSPFSLLFIVSITFLISFDSYYLNYTI